MIDLMVTFVIAAAVAAAATPVAIRFAPRIGAMDIPNDCRRVHDRPIPRLGGVAMYAGMIAAPTRFLPWNHQLAGIVCGGTLMLIIGVTDDIICMKPFTKLTGQIACAMITCFFSVQIRGMMNLLPIGPRYIAFPLWLSFAVTIFWIVGITNTINLIDGLDGLAAGIVCIACLSVAYTSFINGKEETAGIVLCVAGATFGFLIFNFYPAKIFMGDGGSMMLGFMLASVSLAGDTPTKGTTLFATVIPIMILALPIFDTLFAIARRMVNRKPIMQADKGHLHHRIMAMGFGQRRTVLALYSISSIMGVAGILWSSSMKLEAMALFIVAFSLIVIFLGIGILDAESQQAVQEPGQNDTKRSREEHQ